MYGPSVVEIEKRNRIRLLIAACMYELADESWISNDEFDKLAKKINPNVSTDNSICDIFFKTEFSPDTSMWIYLFPELDKLKQLINRLKI
jgi:hypothetical protein